MTETQAKSGAGASTDADDPSVEAPATTSIGTPEAPARAASTSSVGTPEAPFRAASTTEAGAPGSSTETPAPQGGLSALSSTSVVVKSQTPTPKVVATSVPAKAEPTKPGETPRPEAGKAAADGAKPAASKPTDVVRGASAVPIVAGPTDSGTKPSPTKASSAKVGPGTVTGTASVVGATGNAAPVIARAAVTPPNAPVTSVTGTGLRQTTGATSYVSPLATPTRPVTGQSPVRVPESGRPTRTATGGANRGPRRARLHLKRIDPWSVMKFSFAVSLVLFVVAIVATAVLYLALDAMHVWTSLNTALSDVTGAPNESFRITAKGVIGTAVLLGAVNMVLFTALMTLGAFVYNVCADLVGGIELTLSEKE
jgi:Transmembrane domain of unknown function (DUF3566)